MQICIGIIIIICFVVNAEFIVFTNCKKSHNNIIKSKHNNCVLPH